MRFSDLYGARVYTSSLLTVAAERATRLTWRERLLSWPWRPWESLRISSVQVPDPKVYQMGNVIVGHPETIAALTTLKPSRR